MLSSYIVMRPEPLRFKAFNDISFDYSNIGTPLQDSAILLHFQNETDGEILISWFDGIDHMFFPPGAFFVMDIAANQGTGGTMVAPTYTQFQIKAFDALPTLGTFYITALTSYGGPQ